MNQPKRWYTSKIIITNSIALVALILQDIYGYEVISVEAQGMILTAINIILRFFTNNSIE